MSLLSTARAFDAGTSQVLPVYVARAVADGVVEFLAGCVPDEGIVKVFGFDCQHDGRDYALLTDWFAGQAVATHVTATFTDAGLREIELQRLKRYPDRDERPIELGVAHSHPFGSNPQFSGVDVDTFCRFPYDKDNVHLLIDPTAGWFKVFITCADGDGGVKLQQVPWAVFD